MLSRDQILLRNGLLVDPADDPIRPRRADLLVEGGRIASVGADLPTAPDAVVIDASDRIVLPGFVDTHRHTWETAIRSIDPDATLGGYLARVLNTLAPLFRPEDVHIGTLAGAVESLAGGITTLTDWSHLQVTPEHSDAAVEALRRSGIRAIFGYGSPTLAGPDAGAALLPEDVRRVHAQYFDAPDLLVSLGIAARGPGYSSAEIARHEWALARELGVPVSVHAHGDDLIEFLRAEGLLGSDTLYAHATSFSDEALRIVAESGGGVSVAPLVEAQMGHGYPITGRSLAAGVNAGLAVDAVTSTSADMFSVMRTAYSLERARSGSSITASDVLRMATAGGARAVGLGDRVGALRAGLQADLVLLRTDTLAMAPLHDPVTAIVMNADPSVVDTVLVAGRIVKQAGALVDHDVARIAGQLNESGTYLAKASGLGHLAA